MQALTFKGGAHPPEYKHVAEDKAIQVIWPQPGAKLVYPMSQHIGAPCAPIVAKGDMVAIGQKIGETTGFVCSPVHASVSGEVTDITDVLTPGGATSKAVVITYDGKNTEHESINKPHDYEKLEKQEILDIIKEAGIVGMGGAGFPSHIKLNPPAEKPIDTIIMNAAECEPFLTTDYRVLLEETDVVIEGMKIVLKIHPAAKGVIAIENNKPKAIALVEEKCKNIPNISVVALQTKYPQGAEKQLINACTDREVPSGGLPADVGCIVHNVDTIVAIQRAIVRGRPLMRRVITVSGGAVANPGNYKVRIGMSYRDLMDAIGGFKSDPYKMISGGPMMGVAMFSLDVPIIKGSSAFLAFTEAEGKLPEERNCIRCGKCIDHCPIHLLPQELNQNVLAADYAAFRKNNGLDCIECGTCSFVCPAKRHLTQSIRATRRDMLAKKI